MFAMRIDGLPPWSEPAQARSGMREGAALAVYRRDLNLHMLRAESLGCRMLQLYMSEAAKLLCRAVRGLLLCCFACKLRVLTSNVQSLSSNFQNFNLLRSKIRSFESAIAAASKSGNPSDFPFEDARLPHPAYFLFKFRKKKDAHRAYPKKNPASGQNLWRQKNSPTRQTP